MPQRKGLGVEAGTFSTKRIAEKWAKALRKDGWTITIQHEGKMWKIYKKGNIKRHLMGFPFLGF